MTCKRDVEDSLRYDSALIVPLWVDFPCYSQGDGSRGRAQGGTCSIYNLIGPLMCPCPVRPSFQTCTELWIIWCNPVGLHVKMQISECQAPDILQSFSCRPPKVKTLDDVTVSHRESTAGDSPDDSLRRQVHDVSMWRTHNSQDEKEEPHM